MSSVSDDGSRPPRLATRLTLAMVALLVPIYVILLAGYATDVRDQRLNEIANAVLIGQMSASVVDGFRGDIENTLLAAVLALGDQDRPLDQAAVGPYLESLARGNPSLRALFVTDPNGVVVASAEATTGVDVSSREYIRELRAGAEESWSGGLAGLQSGQTTIAYARVIRGPDGAPRGYLVAAFQPAAIFERLPVAFAADASVVLVDERGRILYGSQSTDLGSLADLSMDPLLRPALDGALVRIDGQRTPLAEQAQYGAYVPVGASGWVIGYTRPLATLESALRERLFQQAAAITVVMLAAAVITAVLTRRLLRPLRSLVTAVASVARGERTHVEMADGDADVLALAAAMDAMSATVVEREEALRDEARLVETLRQVGETLAAELDLEKLVQAATDATTAVTGAEVGAFFNNVVDEHGESYLLFTLSGTARESFDGIPMPRNTALFDPTFHGVGFVRVDDVSLDPRYGQREPYHGLPAGHLPVRSFLAVPVISRSGEVLGGLFFGHSRPGMFSERAERLASGIAAQTAIAMDNARLYREAQEAIRMRDQFLSIASHELRTPLAGIKASAQMAQRAHARGTLDSARLTRALATIAEATDRVARLATDLLDVSRLQAGRMPMEFRSVDIAALLEDIAARYREQWEGQRELVVAEDDATLGEIDGDANRLEQVFANLLDNANKYSPPATEVRLAMALDGDGVRVSIADRGIGLPPDAPLALFEPFGRASNAVAQHIQGLGLGLYISRQIVEAHGGRMWAESPGEEQGATFHVWLPRHFDVEATPRPAQSSL